MYIYYFFFCSIKHVQRQISLKMYLYYTYYTYTFYARLYTEVILASDLVRIEVALVRRRVKILFIYKNRRIIILLYLLSSACGGVFVDIISFSNFRDYSDEIYYRTKGWIVFYKR